MRKLLSIVSVLCAAFLLTACGGAEPSHVSQPDASAAASAAEPESAPWTPDGPVTMIVAYKAGSGTDNTARVLTRYAEKYIGQSIEIENIDGGSGSDGWSALASADSDGMTIGFLNLPNFSSSIVNQPGNYTIDDFTALCSHVTETSIVVANGNGRSAAFLPYQPHMSGGTER